MKPQTVRRRKRASHLAKTKQIKVAQGRQVAAQLHSGGYRRGYSDGVKGAVRIALAAAVVAAVLHWWLV